MWKTEEELEKTNEDIYLHGKCHEWTKNNFREGDTAVIINELDEETGMTYLIHCCLIRNDKYVDVRGETDNVDDILEAFDYYDYEVFEYESLDNFIKAINNLGINFS